jgi:hypothetical protein
MSEAPVFLQLQHDLLGRNLHYKVLICGDAFEIAVFVLRDDRAGSPVWSDDIERPDLRPKTPAIVYTICLALFAVFAAEFTFGYQNIV